VRLVRYDLERPSKAQRNSFDCGEPSLDKWLATQAGQSVSSRDAVTYLLMDDEKALIAGYYCISAGEVTRDAAPVHLAKRAPNPIPVVRMGRFAIDRRYQGQGWGADLLREALAAAAAVVELIGGRATLVDAISDAAKRFYEKYGFHPSPIHPMQLLYDLRIVVASAGRYAVAERPTEEGEQARP
jgi:GNAT superfamily N-acetyltransferase